jgi:hypothetical protein
LSDDLSIKNHRWPIPSFLEHFSPPFVFEGEGGGEVEGAQARDLGLTAMVGGPVVEVMKDQQGSER